jgi:PAS domain S-box-containing protein
VEPMTRAYRRLLEEGEPFEVEVEVARPDHKACWLLSRGEAARDASGRIIGARGTVFDITERKLAALAVQRSQHHLRSLIDGLAPSIFVGLLTPEGVIVEANRSPLEAAGIEAQDVLGKPFPEAPWWRGSPQVREQLRAAIVRAAHGEESRYEVQILGRDDEVIDIDFSLQPLRDESGQVIFLIPSAVVITERKRAETALRASESELRALADAMPQIVWISGPDGWNTYMNRRWTDYTGRSAADGAGFAWQKCVHPDDRLRLRDSLQVAGGATSTFLLECRLLGADGAYRWWLLRSEPQYDADGRLLKWVGTATDIHDLKLAELEISRANRELEQQKAELRLLFDLMPALILFKDRENRILRINQFGADATGLRVDEIEGKLAQDIYPEIAGAAHLADLEIIRTGLPQMGTVEKFQTRAGDQVWVQRDRVPLRDANGTVIGIIVMAQDITQRKRDQDALRELNADLESRVRDRTAELSLARSQAEEASRAKSDFLAAMSHEIRTPMSGLLGLLELLQLSTLDHDQQSTVGLARDSGNALLAIIDDILDFSKIEANRLELSWAASSVRSVVETACRLHAQVASSKNLLLRFDVAPQVNALLAVDPLRLGQILNNFLNNAIKFTAVGSIEVMVDVVAQREGIQHLRFVVRDTGIGMSTQQLGRLFQPFAQAEASTSTKFGGTGLGLVIARRLAELMGGTVRIDSEPGVGTTLTLLLSLEVCDASAVVPAPPRGRRDLLEALVAGRRSAPSVEDAQAEGTLLLVVDDHATNRLVLVRQLALLGYAALAAGDGQEGLAAWRSHRFGAVITDCNMPVMNGYEMAMAIRREEQRQGLGRTPVIACTANALPAAVDSCVAAGMDDYIVKPADLAEVNQKLERWVPLKGDSPMLRRSPAGFLDRAAAQPLHGMLDLDLLSELSGGSAAGRSEILADFRRVNDLDVACMRSAAAAGDFAQVLASAHRIKGASLMLGAALLSGTCAGVEVAGAAGDPAGLHLAMGRFEMELLRLRDYMEALA